MPEWFEGYLLTLPPEAKQELANWMNGDGFDEDQASVIAQEIMERISE